MRFLAPVLLSVVALPLSCQKAATVADARSSPDRANAALLKSAVDGSHAEWLAETRARRTIPTNVPDARYFLALIYQFQFYKAMCDASGYHGPLNRCSSYGSKAAGDKLNAMLEKGQSQPWQQTLKEMTGSDQRDAQPMLDYFAPLFVWLKQQNGMVR